MDTVPDRQWTADTFLRRERKHGSYGIQVIPNTGGCVAHRVNGPDVLVRGDTIPQTQRTLTDA